MSILDRLSRWAIERIAYATRYARSIFDVGRRTHRAEFLEHIGRSYRGETVDTEEAYRLAATCSWVYADISLIASRLASDQARPIVAEWSGAKWVEHPEHPANRLLARPNGLMSGSFLIRYSIWWLMLSGNAYIFVATDRPRLGTPKELWPLIAPQVTPIADRIRSSGHGPVIDYQYSVNGETFILPGEHMIHLRYPNPWDYWRGLSPLSAALMAIQADHHRAKWDRDFFGEDNALPAAILSLPPDISDVDFDRAQAEIRAEFGGRRRTAITRAGDLTVQTVQQTIADMQMREMRELSRQEIDRVFGIPDGLFSGATSGDSRIALETALAVNTLQPLADHLAEEFTRVLLPFYPDASDYVFWAKPLAPRDRALHIQEYMAYSPDRTINENRSELGLPPLPDPLSQNVPVRLLPFVAPSLSATVAPTTSPYDITTIAAAGDAQAPMPSLVDMPSPKQMVAQESQRRLDRASSAGISAELKRWQKSALRAYRQGNLEEALHFRSEILPEVLRQRIQNELKQAQNDDDIRETFMIIIGEVEAPEPEEESLREIGIPVEIPCPLCGQVGVEQFPDHGNLCVCQYCEATFDPAYERSHTV